MYSPKTTKWGEWGEWEFCPSGTFVSGFTLKVQTQVSGDNTALNGVKLFCTPRGSMSVYKTLKSSEGPWGYWNTQSSYCGAATAVGFQLRSEKPAKKGGQDETAGNNLRLLCDSGWVLTGGGMSWGDWGAERRCPNGGFICGLKTQVEQDQENGKQSIFSTLSRT